MRLTAIHPIFLLALAYVPTASSLPCGDLKECISSGEKLMTLIRTARRDTDGPPAKYLNGYQKLEKRINEDNTWHDISKIMEGLQDTMSPKLTTVTIESEKGTDIAYQNAYDKGIIAAIASYNQYDPVPKQDQVHWDVVAFEQYRATGCAPTDLTYILQHTVDNDNTKRMVNQVYDDAGMGPIRVKAQRIGSNGIRMAVTPRHSMLC
jgi:hypothetical protein